MSQLFGDGHGSCNIPKSRQQYGPGKTVRNQPVSSCVLRSMRACVRHRRACILAQCQSRIVTLVHDPATLDDEQLSGNEITIGAGKKERRADDVCRCFDAFEATLVHTAFSSLEHVRCHGLFAHG